MNREKIGYFLTMTALAALLIYHGVALFYSYRGNWAQTLLGACFTFLPLLYFTPPAIKRVKKSFAALALIAPIQLFFGGIIWLWGMGLQGAWVCCWAVILQIGTILHNYQRREKRVKK